MVKERLFAWLVENDRSKWSEELKAMKYSHNSEWIQELGGTPIDLFYRRRGREEGVMGAIRAEQLINDVKDEQ